MTASGTDGDSGVLVFEAVLGGRRPTSTSGARWATGSGTTTATGSTTAGGVNHHAPTANTPRPVRSATPATAATTSPYRAHGTGATGTASASAVESGAQGYGTSRPVGKNDTEAGRARNRRVQFEILPPT